jgi:hypothetical protein
MPLPLIQRGELWLVDLLANVLGLKLADGGMQPD